MVKIPLKNSHIHIMIRICTSNRISSAVASRTSHPTKISSKFVFNFLSYTADRQTGRQAHKGKNNTFGRCK